MKQGGTFQATEVIADNSSIEVEGFKLDLNNGVITLTFTETFDISSLNVSTVTIQGSEDASERDDSIALGSPISTKSTSYITVEITLSSTDLNKIKTEKLIGTSSENTFLSIAGTLVSDTFGNGNKAIPVTAGIAAEDVEPDDTSPMLSNHTLNMDAGSITLTFDEPVDPESFYFSDLKISDLNSNNVVSLSDDSSTSSTPSTIFEVTIKNDVLNDLKANENVATTKEDTYLTYTSSLVKDMAGKSVVGKSVVQIGEFIPDETEPRLLEYTIDMNAGKLLLTFSETIRVSSLNLSKFSIENSEDHESATSSVSLRDTKASGNSATFEIEFGDADFEDLVFDQDVATSSLDSFLYFTNGSAFDMAGNPINDTEYGIGKFIGDTTRPQLTNFTLDYGENSLILTFDEPVNKETVLVTSFTLQSSSDGGDQFELTTDSSVGGTSGYEITIKLGPKDINDIKKKSGLATNRTNTYLSLDSTALQDFFEFPVRSIPTDSAKRAAEVVPDEVGPALSSFSLDLDSGELFLTFDETVVSDTLVFSKLAFQNNDSETAISVELNTGVNPGVTDISFKIVLDGNDLDSIKVASLANDENDTYLHVFEDAIEDSVKNGARDRTVKVSELTDDTSPPEVDTFDFDMNTGILTLHFDEAINLKSFDASELTIINKNRAIPPFTVLNPSAVTSELSANSFRDLELTFDNSELNDIKRTGLCRRESACYVYFGTNLVNDTAGNQVVEVKDIDTKKVDGFVEDTNPPDISSFVLFDLDSGIVSFTFNETIDVSSINLTSLNFSDYYANTLIEATVSLTGGTVNTGDNDTLSFQISKKDLDAIKT